MRIQPVAASPRPWFFGPTDAPFTPDSDLRGMIIRMISTNALAAFTTQVAPTRPAQPVRGVSPGVGANAAGDAQPAQRTLDAVPAAPARPLPRGSLLDLRV
ncbi:MAG: hypothetical protein JWP04_510 [Belnapia sp.]|nr:hypothetical protein [Belnapia sp.]